MSMLGASQAEEDACYGGDYMYIVGSVSVD